jgi:hypothetical protein
MAVFSTSVMVGLRLLIAVFLASIGNPVKRHYPAARDFFLSVPGGRSP